LIAPLCILAHSVSLFLFLLLFYSFPTRRSSDLKRVVFETGSCDLLIALLLTDLPKKEKLFQKFLTRYSLPATDEVDYKELSKTIIKKETCTKQILTPKSCQLPHFFLFLLKNKNLFFPKTF